jgi:formate dehydrogenase subunit gamma
MQGNPVWCWAARLGAVLLIALLPATAANAQANEAVVVPQQQDSRNAQQPSGGDTREAGKMQQQGQPAEANRQGIQPFNNAPLWRDVRSGDINAYQTTQVRGPETNVLIQSEGETWRRIRNGPITVYGGWLIVAVFLAIGLFYWWRGEIMLHEPRTGREIVRFTAWERLVHWTTAIAFVILAVSGIFMLFGRYVILPLFGYPLFSTLTIVGKNLHNFVGPLFVVCTVLMVITYLRDNFWRSYDWTWLRRMGDFLKGEEVPAGKYNAGEKLWFWFGVLLLGVGVSASGLVLDFPNFGQGREAMQIANIVHAVLAIGFMAMGLGHIYIGTIGMEGAYDAMRHGTVDETWAKEHHDIWYRQLGLSRERPAPGMTANTAPADSMKDGWKT